MDDVASLDSWKPVRTIAPPTSTFAGSNAGVRLQTGRTIGKNIRVMSTTLSPTINATVTVGGQRSSRPPMGATNRGSQNQQQHAGVVEEMSPLSQPPPSNLHEYITQSPTTKRSAGGKGGGGGGKSVPNRFAPIPRQKIPRQKPPPSTMTPNLDGTVPWNPAANPVPSGGPDMEIGKGSSPIKGAVAPSNPIAPAHIRLYPSPPKEPKVSE